MARGKVMDIEKATIAAKAQEQFEIEKEAENIQAFILASMIKLLAFQVDVLGQVKAPPKKKLKDVMALAKKKIEEFKIEVYAEPKEGDSPKGIIQDSTF
jgi:hypothetical protein